jgi:hypothetical protein
MNEEITGVLVGYGSSSINTQDASTYISSDVASQSEVDKLKEQVELLKRVTDVEYAKECVRKEILEEYKKLVLTDVWFEACSEYIRKRVDEICESYNKQWFLSSGGFLTIESGIGGNWSNDIVFHINGKTVKVSELFNPYPKIEGLEFEKFVIQYCNEKGRN